MELEEEQKQELKKIAVSGMIYIAALILYHKTSGLPRQLSVILFVAAYLVAGLSVLKEAAENLKGREIFDENFLMSLATLGAFAIRQYPEAVAVMLFYEVGELFEDMAVDHSRKSISAAMNIRPDYANLKTASGEEKVKPESVKVGDSILIRPGERIPLDAEVTEGESLVDTAALTGEPVPRTVRKGDSLLSGCINMNAVLTARVTRPYGESTVSKILNLVENASARKSEQENFIHRFAAVYTPAVVFAALALAFIPPLFLPGHPFSTWIYRALTFLVVSCPCALVISIPLSFFGGIGGASRQGILVKGGNFLEALAKTEIAVFDKTGTLTKGVFEVQEILPENGFTEEELLRTLACAENFSSHPIAVSIKKAYGRKIDATRIGKAEEEAGHGIRVTVDGKRILAGNAKLMEEAGIRKELPVSGAGTVIHVAQDGIYAGSVLISDREKDDAAAAISGLKKNGVRKTVMLTGDGKAAAEAMARKLKLDEFHAELLPGDKVDQIERLMGEKSKNGKLIFVGDGINDAPVLARADVGVAMGGLGSDAAVEAADVVIMTDEPAKLVTAIRIARKTLRIAKENTVFAIIIKLVILVLGAMGITAMWEAVFADVGVAILAILNSMRNLGSGENGRKS